MPSSHAIRRQVIEVTVPDQATAHWIVPLVSMLVRDRMTPLLERLFDAASPPDDVIHIDRLELDLGRLDPDAFAEQSVDRLVAALSAALRQAFAQGAPARVATGRGAPADAARPDQAAAPLLLIGQFARTGSLPWWSDTSRRRVLDEAMVAAVSASPAALVRTVRGLAGDDAALERLIAHLSDEALASLLRAMLPPAEALSRTLIPVLERTPALAGFTRARFRLLAWRALIRAALGGVRLALIETALTELAAEAGTMLALVVSDLRPLIDEVAEEPLAGEIAELAARYPPPAPVGGSTDIATLFARLAMRPELAPLLARLRPMAARLTPSGTADWAAALGALAGDTSSMAAPSRIAALLRPFAREGLIRPVELRDELAPLASAEADAAVPAEAPPAPAEDDDSRLVETAGLCLLWPFLPRFFARLGLLDESGVAFAGPPAAHRAVLLLHHVATGETEAPDYALVLAKALCGLAPHVVHHAPAPIDAREADEASQLLDAVIAHAACLGDITRDGLRGSFLIRPGILTTRDGAWLLRVERRTEDVVLDRLPWSFQWARLPWMPAPMRVEW